MDSQNIQRLLNQFKRMRSQRYILIVILILIAIIIAAFYWYKRSHSSQTLIAKVEKHIQLPANESPAIATVSDQTKIKSQEFFSDAENGDILLIYNTSQKAVLYRPSIDKIINITTVAMHTATPALSPIPRRISVAIYNGTQIAGLASRMEKRLIQEFPAVTVIAKSNTVANYTENLIIDLSGSNNIEAKDLATAMKGAVSALPAGEKKPAADILIIIGKEI